MGKIKSYDLGNSVVCDICNENYTDSDECGGITFGSYAVCPKCTPRIEKRAKESNEVHRIEFRCPPDKSFKDWVIEDLRHGKPGKMEIISL